MLGANSRIKGEKDWQKYEKARELKKHIATIRADYEVGFQCSPGPVPFRGPRVLKLHAVIRDFLNLSALCH